MLTGAAGAQQQKSSQPIREDELAADIITAIARGELEIEEESLKGNTNRTEVTEISPNDEGAAEKIASESPTKAEIENEFNNINPIPQSDAERYEERIVQLQSAPLPCIDAVTGLVHIVGTTHPVQNGFLILHSAAYYNMQTDGNIMYL